MKYVNTGLDYRQQDFFEFFLERNNIKATVGTHNLNFQSGGFFALKVYFAYDEEDFETAEAITVMTLRHGSVEEAYIAHYREFCNTVGII